MAAIDWDDVIAFDSSLTSVDDAAQDDILNHVNAHFDVGALDGEDGPDTRLARIYLAAHHGLGAVPGTGNSGGGAVTSESGGGLSVSYAVDSASSSNTTALGETVWGRKYLAITRTSLARVWVVL